MTTAISPVVQPIIGQRVTVPYPVGQSSQLAFALVANSTAWNLAVDQGSQLGVLPAFTANVYPVGAIGSPMGFTASGSSLAAGDGIRVTWSDTPPPGAWPSSLTSQALSVLGSVFTTNTQANRYNAYTGLAAGATTTINVPIGTTDSFVVVSTTNNGGTHGDPFWCKVVGHQSGIVYAPVLYVSINHADSCPVLSSLDTSVDLVITTPSGGLGVGNVIVTGTSLQPQFPPAPVETFSAQSNAGAVAEVIGGMAAPLYVFKLLGMSWNITNNGGNLFVALRSAPFGGTQTSLLLALGTGAAGEVDFRPGVIFGWNPVPGNLTVTGAAAGFASVSIHGHILT